MRWWVLGVVMGCSGADEAAPKGGEDSGPTSPTPSDTDTGTAQTTDTSIPVTGETGAAQATGDTGDTGAIGNTGNTGNPGNTGDTGSPIDNDRDGFIAAVDCDDADPLTYPGAPPRLFIDSDCSGQVAVDPDTADYEFFGTSPAEQVYDVASAGDVDGDGLPDLLINIFESPSTVSVRLFLGASLPSPPATLDYDTADYVFLGSRPAALSAAGVGDVDGDGLDDIAIGIPTSGTQGEVYVFLGASLGLAPVIPLDASDYLITGDGDAQTVGSSVASAGDVDGDGLGDLVIGATGTNDSAGAAAVVVGSSLGAAREMLWSDAAHTFEGESPVNYAGSSVACAGDVDGDGLDDLIIGARFATDSSGAYRSGRAYVLLGANLSPGASSLGAADYILEEHSVPGTGVDWSTLGSDVSSAGDFDGDGLDDLLVGAPGGAQYPFYPWEGPGVAYGVSAANLTPITTLSDVGVSFDGVVRDFAGQSVASGDFDGDGLGDFLVGAPGDEYYYTPARVHVFLSNQLVPYTLIPEFTAEESTFGSMLGAHVAAFPDLDGDGRDEVIMEGDNKVYLALSRL